MTREKSTEEQVVRIDTIVGDEVLGYQGEGREEHSGQPDPEEGDNTGIGHDIADNRPEQVDVSKTPRADE